MLCDALVLLKSAAPPTAAVFPSAVLLKSVAAPTAVFNWPSTLLLSENQPTAVLLAPEFTLRLKRAFWPSAVLPPGYPPSGAGTTACAFGKSPKQASTNRIVMQIVMVFRLFHSTQLSFHGFAFQKAFYGLLRATFGPALLVSTCALTFCRPAVSASICSFKAWQ